MIPHGLSGHSCEMGTIRPSFLTHRHIGQIVKLMVKIDAVLRMGVGVLWRVILVHSVSVY